MRIEPHDDMGGAVLNCAVRYALGRASYIPGLVMDEIRPMLAELTAKTLYCMERDIREWVVGTGNQKNQYWEEWGDFLKLIEEQFEKQKNDATPGEDDRIDFMIFSKRMALAKAFEEWANENDVAKTPASVVTFLYSFGVLDVQAAFRLIEKNDKDEE